jgi:hypothetical protein
VAFAKVIAPLMARTDFGSMFMRLPAKLRKYFASSNGQRWALLWIEILDQAGLGRDLHQPVFANDPGAARGASLPTALSRVQWLSGILIGEDRLTSAHVAAIQPGRIMSNAQADVLDTRYGDATAAGGQPATADQAANLTDFRKQQLFGLGSLGDRHEAVGPNIQSPIFELRRMMQNVSTHEFTEMALGVYDFLARLNAANPGEAVAPYQRQQRRVAKPDVIDKLRFRMAA